MHFGPTFYRTAAICSVLSAVTTLGLIFLPNFFIPVDGFEERMARVHDPAYVLRSWVYFVHPFLVMMAGLAIAARIRTLAAAFAVVGLLGFVIWGFTEAAQQAMTLFAFDKWRVAFATADEATRAEIRTLTMMYDGLWDGMYFLILVGFAIGNFCLSVVLFHLHGLARVTGLFMFAAVLLTLTLIARDSAGSRCPSRSRRGATRRFNHLAASSSACGCGGWPTNRCRCGGPPYRHNQSIPRAR